MREPMRPCPRHHRRRMQSRPTPPAGSRRRPTRLHREPAASGVTRALRRDDRRGQVAARTAPGRWRHVRTCRRGAGGTASGHAPRSKGALGMDADYRRPVTAPSRAAGPAGAARSCRSVSRVRLPAITACCDRPAWPGRGCSRCSKEAVIAQRGELPAVSLNTVLTQIKSLCEKREGRSRTEAVFEATRAVCSARRGMGGCAELAACRGGPDGRGG